MSISATAKAKAASNRFMLVRVTPARLISLDLASAGGGIYSLTIPGIQVSSVQRNGSALTAVTTVANNDEWSIDDTTGAFQIKLASAPNETSNLVVIFYDLYYTTEKTRVAYHTPSDSTTKVREWQPLLRQAPTVNQTVKDTIVGVMQIDASELEIIDTDRAFRGYLGRRDSFKDKDVKIWLCVDTVSDMDLIFTGKVSRLVLIGNNVRLSVLDNFSKMRQLAYMGDTQGECVMTLETGSYTAMDPNKVGYPCRYISAPASRFVTTSVGTFGATNDNWQYFTGGLEAVCTNYSATVANTANRVWTLCRLPGATATQSFGAIQAASDTGSNKVGRFASLTNVEVGDTIKWVEAATTYYEPIGYNQTFTYSAVSYNTIITNASSNTFTTSSTVTGQKSMAIMVVTGGVTYRPLYGRDYTISETTTSGGNTLVTLTFVNNFEANLSGIGNFHPSTHQVFYRVSTAASMTHGTVLKRVCDAAGLTTNATTFTAADSSLTANTAFCIPYYDQQSYDSYLTYAEDILKSTYGILSLNVSGTVDYYILALPSGVNTTTTDLYLRDSLSSEVVYDDVSTTLQAYNPHVANLDAIKTSGTGPNYSVTNNIGKYLHSNQTTILFRHVLQAIQARVLRISATLASRKTTYTFDTATDNLSSVIGDDLILSSTDVHGTTKTQSVKVIGTSKSIAKCTLTVCDFEGLQ